MIIGPIEKKISDQSVIVQTSVEYGQERKTLWYSFNKNLEEFITTEKHDGFLVGMLLLGMKLGEDIHIEGNVSPKLYYNLTDYYIPIVKSVIPDFCQVRIIPKGFINKENYKSGNSVITGFSAGIDSFCTIYDHLESEVPDEYKITHFLFNNVGSHGEWNTGKAEKLFLSRFELIKGFTEDVSIPFIKVNSNLSEVLNMNFQQTHVPRNVSSVLLLQGLISKYYYASTYKYQDCFVGKTYDFAYVDPFSLHLLSTETLDCISSGCQYSRVDKTLNVSKVKSSQDWLNVCVNPTADGKNCSTCWKCNRTLFTFELLSVLEKYRNVFDLEKWKWSKKWYVPSTILNMKNHDPLVDEIRTLASEKKYKYTIRDRLLGLFFSVTPERVLRIVKRFM